MWIKRLTGLLLVIGFCLLLGWPWIGGRPPEGKVASLAYSRLMLVYVGALVVVMAGAATGAAMIVRQAREDYRRQSAENMRKLLEGMRKDASNDDA